MRKHMVTVLLVIAALFAGCGEKASTTPSDQPDPTDYRIEKAGSAVTPWQEGELDIHFINTTTGECVFMVFPDGTQMLIDAAGSLAATGTVGSTTNTGIRSRWDPTVDASWRPAPFIASYIRKVMAWTGNDTVDYALVTHFHNDHFGGYSTKLPVSDKSSTYRKQSMPELMDLLPFGKLMDRGYPDYNYPFDMRTKASNADGVDNYVKAVLWHVANTGLKAEKFTAGSAGQITLLRKAGDYPDFEVRNIAVNGEIWDGGETGTATATFPPLSEISVANPASVANEDNCPEENHCSCVLKVRYGAFDFFAGGDSQYDGMSYKTWKDMETPVAKAAGPVDVMKADHHGVTNTNGHGFKSSVTGKTAEALRYLQPRVWVVNSWTDGHPRQKVYEGVTNYMPAMDIYITNTCDAMSAYANAGRVTGSNGHVLVRVYKGGAKYRVCVLSDSDGAMTVRRTMLYNSR